MRLYLFMLAALVMLMGGCNLFDSDGLSLSKPNAENVLAREGLGRFANDYFWDQFHQGNYDQVDSVLYYLTAAYNDNPNNLETVSHLGFAHVWKLSERTRLDEIPPTIIDHGALNLKYFSEAYDMNPRDARVLGFLADAQMTVGSINDDPRMQRQGFFDGQRSIRKWPEFNYFTIGYLFSDFPHTEKRFQDALEGMWETMDICVCDKVDRENPDYGPYLALEAQETDPFRLRACWNSWIAPHNLEGFFLNMGDMMVKSGDWQRAVRVYELAKQAPEYDTWPFQAMLDRRIANAEENVTRFREEVDHGQVIDDDQVVLFRTSVSCAACHQFSEADQVEYAGFDRLGYFEEMNIYNLR